MDNVVKSHVQIFVNGVRTATAYAELKSKDDSISAEEFSQQLQEYLKIQLRNDEANAGEKNIKDQRGNVLSRLWDALPPEAQIIGEPNNAGSSQLSGHEEDENLSQASSIMEDLLSELNNIPLDRSKSCPCKHFLKKPKNLLKPAHKRSKTPVLHCEADLSFIQAIVWLKSAIAMMKQVPVDDFMSVFNKQWNLKRDSQTEDFCTIFEGNASSLKPLVENLKHMKFDASDEVPCTMTEENNKVSSEISNREYKPMNCAMRQKTDFAHVNFGSHREEGNKKISQRYVGSFSDMCESSESLGEGNGVERNVPCRNRQVNVNDSIDVLRTTELRGKRSADDGENCVLRIPSNSQKSSETGDDGSPARMIPQMRKRDDFRKPCIIIPETDDESESDSCSVECEPRTTAIDDSGFLSENIDSELNSFPKLQTTICTRKTLRNENLVPAERTANLISTNTDHALKLRPTVATFRFDNLAGHQPSDDKFKLPKSILKIKDCQKKSGKKIVKSVRFAGRTEMMENQSDSELSEETQKSRNKNLVRDFLAKGNKSMRDVSDSSSPDIADIDLQRPFWEFRFSNPKQQDKVTTGFKETVTSEANDNNVQTAMNKVPEMSTNEQIESKLYRFIDEPDQDVNSKFQRRDSKYAVEYESEDEDSESYRPNSSSTQAASSDYSKTLGIRKTSVKRKNECDSESNISFSKKRRLEKLSIPSASLNYIIRTSETNDLLLRSVKTVLGAIEDDKIVACFGNWRGSMEKEAVEAVVSVVDILDTENASKSCRDEVVRMIQRVFDKILQSDELGKATTWDHHTSIILELCDALSICKEIVGFLTSKLKILTSVVSRAPDESIIESTEIVERSFFIFRALDIVLRKYREMSPRDGTADENKGDKIADVTELWKRHWNVEQRDDEVADDDHEECWMNILEKLAVASSENWPQVTMLAWKVAALLKN